MGLVSYPGPREVLGSFFSSDGLRVRGDCDFRFGQGRNAGSEVEKIKGEYAGIMHAKRQRSFSSNLGKLMPCGDPGDQRVTTSRFEK